MVFYEQVKARFGSQRFGARPQDPNRAGALFF